ncbi:uncharacterized protein LOC119482544 [Tachysurus ichikawai]
MVKRYAPAQQDIGSQHNRLMYVLSYLQHHTSQQDYPLMQHVPTSSTAGTKLLKERTDIIMPLSRSNPHSVLPPLARKTQASQDHQTCASTHHIMLFGQVRVTVPASMLSRL